MNTQDTLLAFGEWLDSKGIIKSDRGQGADTRSHDQLAADFIVEWETGSGAAPLAGRDCVELVVHGSDGTEYPVAGIGYHIDGDSHLHVRSASGNVAAFNRNYWSGVTEVRPD